MVTVKVGVNVLVRISVMVNVPDGPCEVAESGVGVIVSDGNISPVAVFDAVGWGVSVTFPIICVGKIFDTSPTGIEVDVAGSAVLVDVAGTHRENKASVVHADNENTITIIKMIYRIGMVLFLIIFNNYMLILGLMKH